MSRTASTMLDIGTRAPDFILPDVVTEKKVSMSDCAADKGFLVMFISRHCPYVQHVAKGLASLGTDYEGVGLGVVAISSNYVANYPDDAPDKLKIMANEFGFNFPVLYDESQDVAKAYKAACTPDFFLFDGARNLVYRGQLDDSRPGTGIPVTGADLRAAVDAVLSGGEVTASQKPSIGCNIKWKPGNEPEWFAV